MSTTEQHREYRKSKVPRKYTVTVTYYRDGSTRHYSQPTLRDALDCANYCAELSIERHGARVTIHGDESVVMEWAS